ncbi:MAG: DivIVA domain-containing protein [Acidimicrobiales bacterium]|jgi:hypothetical protein
MPEETPVVSISSSTINPDEIPRRTFPAARKGVDADAVRRYLDSVADDVRALLDRETQLRRRLAEAEKRASEPPVLDEATLHRAVGAETARVLQSAAEAAHEMVARAEARAAELLAGAKTEAAGRTSAAEEESARLLEAAADRAGATAADAQAEATALREAAEEEAEAIIEAARDDAVSLLDTTKQRCRQTVRDARQRRKAVLSDLVERRRSLFVQLEQLRSGRDSLVEVVEAVEETVEALKVRLADAEHDARMAAAEGGDRAETFVDDEVEALMEPDTAFEAHSESLGEGSAEELAEELGEGVGSFAVLTPESAVIEVDVELAEDDLSGDEEDEERAHEVRAQDTAASHRSVGELFARIRAARSPEAPAPAEETVTGAPEPAAEAESVGAAAAPSVEAEEGAGEAPEEPAAEAPAAAAAVAETAAPEGGDRADEPTEEVPVVATDEAGEEAAAAEAPADGDVAAADAEAATEPSQEAVPGAATAATAEEPAADKAPSDEASGDEAAVAEGEDADAAARGRRNEMLGPVMAQLSRALKRALQDDQNELLNAIRHASGAPDLDVLLPEPAQRERFAQAASGALAEGWLLGRSWLRPDGAGESEADEAALKATASETGQLLGLELSAELAGLLRHRLSEALRPVGEISEGAQDVAGAAYREWKGPRVEGIAGDFATGAFAQGAIAAAAGTSVRWVVDDGKPCPDCDDNALAGVQAAGEPWPTGQAHPPVHPGCRCLLVATTD